MSQTVQKTHFKIACLRNQSENTKSVTQQLGGGRRSGAWIYCNANNKAGDLLPLLCIKAKSMFSFGAGQQTFLWKTRLHDKKKFG